MSFSTVPPNIISPGRNSRCSPSPAGPSRIAVPLRIVRDPDSYEKHEVRWALQQYIQMFGWFRSRWPDAKLSAYNLSPSSPGHTFPLAEMLGLRFTDSIDVSMYWNAKENWRDSRQQIMSYAVELGRQHDLPVIVWVWDRYLIWNNDRTVATYKPLSYEAVEQMVELAISEGVDIVVLWSNTYGLLTVDSSRIIEETINRDDDDDPLPAINARMVQLMAEMRLRAEQRGHG
ncbi:MAG: hypothetical protein IID31_09020 [Planctomycetes bacterium]|nr:hypothetical protein [Planctomycetota bacterium]